MKYNGIDQKKKSKFQNSFDVQHDGRVVKALDLSSNGLRFVFRNVITEIRHFCTLKKIILKDCLQLLQLLT